MTDRVDRLLLGAIAGFTATAAMTGVMNRLHRRLPKVERYPLPPREITQRLAGNAAAEPVLQDAALAAHFAYGGLAGALLTTLSARPGMAKGAAYGALVWAGSYLGWIPATGILKPAWRHPWRRNLLMLGAHLVWGATTGLLIKELGAARIGMLGPGPLADQGSRHDMQPAR